MPRKTQFAAEDVVTAALELVRVNGLAGLSAPEVARKMGSSTMPIYSHFKNMQPSWPRYTFRYPLTVILISYEVKI
jgi:hypothetical protein